MESENIALAPRYQMVENCAVEVPRPVSADHLRRIRRPHEEEAPSVPVPPL